LSKAPINTRGAPSLTETVFTLDYLPLLPVKLRNFANQNFVTENSVQIYYDW